MSLQPAIGTGNVATTDGLASIIQDLRRRLAQIEAQRTSVNPGAITGTQIADGTIGAAQIVAGSITAELIAAGTITANNIAANTITALQIAANAITTDELAANSVTSAHIQAGTIVAGDIQSATITAAQIAANTITAAQIAAHTITATEIAAHTITATEIQAGTITAVEITAGTITGDRIAANTITATNIAASTITATQIAATTITAAQIAASTITATQIAASTITSDKLAVTSLSAITTNMGSLTAGTITGGTIQSASSGARTVMNAAGLTAYGLDGTTKTFELNSGSGIATLTGIVIAQAGSTIPGTLITGTIPGVVLPPIGGSNYITNSSVESASPLNFVAIASASGLASSATQAKYGSKSLTWTATGVNSRLRTNDHYPAIVGNAYTYSFWVRTPTSRTVKVRANYWDTATDSTITPVDGPGFIVPANTWTRVSFIGAVVPAGQSKVSPGVIVTDSANTEIYYADGFQMEEGDILTNYAPKPDEILPGTITGTEIANDAIGTVHITNGSVTDTKIVGVDAAKLSGTLNLPNLGVNLGGGNLLKNSGGEGGTTNWAALTNVALASETDVANARYGSKSIRMTASAAGDMVAATPATDRAPAQPGVTYTVSAYFKPNATVRNVAVAPVFVNSGGSILSAVYGTEVTEISGGWVRATQTATAPASTATVGIRTKVVSAASGGIHYMDGAQLEESNVVSAYAPKADEILPGTITGVEIANDAIGTVHITNGAVTDTKINAVGASKVTGQLTDAQLAAISAAKLTGQITTTQITDNAITTPKIFAGAVTTNEIAANTITAADIASATITATQIASGTITAAQIAAGTITATEIAVGTIVANRLSIVVGGGNFLSNSGFENISSPFANWSNSGATRALDTVVFKRGFGTTSAKLTATGTAVSQLNPTSSADYYEVVAGRFYSGSFWTRASGALGNARARLLWFDASDNPVSPAFTDGVDVAQSTTWKRIIVTGAAPAGTVKVRLQCYTRFTGATAGEDFWMDDAQLEEGDVVTSYAPRPDEILPGTIVASMIAANTITANEIAANTITANQIAADTITANQIAANAITVSELAANSVTAAKIVANTITAAQIATDTLTANEIAANAITTNEIAANTIQAGDIAANTITAGQIAAGTITATEIAVGSITANRLSVVVGGGNFLGNSGFENTSSAFANWSTASGATRALDSVTFKRGFGVTSAKLTATGDGIVHMTNPMSSGDYYEVVAGRYYSGSFWTRASATNGDAKARLLWYDAADSPVTDPSSGLVYAEGASVTQNTTWKRVFVTSAAPTGTVKVRLQTFGRGANVAAGTGTGVNYWLDDAQLEEGDVITSYAPKPDEILPGTIVASMIAAGTITSNEISANTITAADIAADTITATEIASNAITVNELAANSVTAAKIVANTITATQIAANTITAAQIAATTITAAQIASGTLTSSQIQAGSILTQSLNFYTPSPNLIWDAGFEFSTSEGAWANSTNGAYATSTTSPKSGAQVGTLTQSGIGQTLAQITLKTTKRPVVVTGKTYTGSVYYRQAVAKTNRSAFIQIQWLNAAGAGLGTVSGSTVALPNDNTTWTRATVTATAPASAVAGNLMIRVLTTDGLGFGATGEVYHLDEAMLEPGEAVSPVFTYREGDIQPGSVGNTLITTDAITTDKILAASILGADIAATTITAANIAANTITATQIAANTITAGQIASGTITATQIAAGTITATLLSATALDASTITGATIRTNTNVGFQKVHIDSTGLSVLGTVIDPPALLFNTSNPGTAWFYKITSVNSSGETTPMAEFSTTAPTGAFASGAGYVKFDITKAPEATSYKVYKGTATGAQNVVATFTPNLDSVTDTIYVFTDGVARNITQSFNAFTSGTVPASNTAGTVVLNAAIGSDRLTADFVDVRGLGVRTAYDQFASFPTSPEHGTIVQYRPDNSSPILWTFRYNSNLSSNKWEFVGGSPLYNEGFLGAANATTINNASYATSGIAVVTTLPGIYIVEFGASPHMSGGQADAFLSFSVSATAASDTDAAWFWGNANTRMPGSRKVRKTLPGNNNVTLAMRSAPALNVAWANLWLTVTPVQVAG